MNPFRTLFWTATGLAATPLLEYVWHRWIAHVSRPDETRDQHLEHHRTASECPDPWDEMRENAPRIGKAALAINAALAPFLGLRRTLPLTAGLVGGYALTTLYHAQMHERRPHNAYEEWMWRFHWHHHAADARVNFGLTNPVFDFVFGSAVVPETVEIPEKLAPAWLGDAVVAGISAKTRAASAAN